MITVKLPKRVSVSNFRLAFFHFGMVLFLLVVLTYFFLAGNEFAMSIPIVTLLKISWDEANTIAGMESYFAGSDIWQAQCDELESANLVDEEKWGYTWGTRQRCTTMCTLDDFFSHAAWSNTSRRLQSHGQSCWSDFKRFGLGQKYTALQFTESSGQRDLHLITAKNDWVVDHGEQTMRHYVEVVPQGSAASIEFGYSYTFAQRAKWFFWNGQEHVVLQGDNLNARTVILNADGTPVGAPIPPGGPIKFTIDQIMSWARRDDGASRPVEHQDFMAGAEINMGANCFGSDSDLNAELENRAAGRSFHYGATLSEPVCVLKFEVVSSAYSVNVEYSTPLAAHNDFYTEVMSETTGFYFKAVSGAGTASVLDINTILLNLTSMLVILALPTHVTTFVAARLLGPVSEMYRRVIIEPYDIELQTSGAATVLAANTGTFNRLKRLRDDGQEIIDLPSVHALIRKTMASRSQVMNSREVASLSHFLYDDIRSRSVHVSDQSNVGCLDAIFDVVSASAVFQRHSTPGDDEPEGISLDQWNQARLSCEKMTFEALVQLFDKDRPRWFLERFFTPPRIRKALLRAMHEEERRLYESHSIDKTLDKMSEQVERITNSFRETFSGSSNGVPHERKPENHGFRKSGTDTIDEIHCCVDVPPDHLEVDEPDIKPAWSSDQHPGFQEVCGQPEAQPPPVLRDHPGFQAACDQPEAQPPPMLGDLRQELDFLSERLRAAERGVQHEFSHTASSAVEVGHADSEHRYYVMGHHDSYDVRWDSKDSRRSKRSNGSETQAAADPAYSSRGLDEVEKRLSEVESSVQALHRERDAGPPADLSCRATSRPSRTKERAVSPGFDWATAVIESFGHPGDVSSPSRAPFSV